jgi:hypothetical protein
MLNLTDLRADYIQGMLATIVFKIFLSSHLLSENIKSEIYKTIILPVVLYGCETWSLTLREEHRLTAFFNKVLRRIFEPKREEVAGGWKNYIMRHG